MIDDIDADNLVVLPPPAHPFFAGVAPSQDQRRARAEKLADGLCSSPVVREDSDLVHNRGVEFFEALRPQNHVHSWLVTQIATVSLRVDRNERMERRVRDKMAIRAELFWDDDRRLDAMVLGETLACRPAFVVEQLRRTPHGCDWLMQRWALLAHAGDVNKVWTPAQNQLAFDMLGTPPEFREGMKPGMALDVDGRVIAGLDDPASVARREIDVLKVRRELVSVVDRADRALACSDLTDDNCPELRRVHQRESVLHGRLRWLMAQLRYESPHPHAVRGLMTIWLGHREPSERPKPPVIPMPPAMGWNEGNPAYEPDHPPFNLEIDEIPAPGMKLDVPAILAGRRAKELKKQDRERDERRRKLEKLRG